MGLISRVSSRTYRNNFTQISINMGRSRSRSPARRERSRSPPARRYNSADLHSVRIGGRDSLPGDVTREEVEEIFGKFGEIGDIYLPRDRDTRELRGFGFVRFVKKDDQEYCLKETNELIRIAGVETKVEFCKPFVPRDRDDRGGFGGDRRGGDDRRGGYGGGRDDRRYDD